MTKSALKKKFKELMKQYEGKKDPMRFLQDTGLLQRWADYKETFLPKGAVDFDIDSVTYSFPTKGAIWLDDKNIYVTGYSIPEHGQTVTCSIPVQLLTEESTMKWLGKLRKQHQEQPDALKAEQQAQERDRVAKAA